VGIRGRMDWAIDFFETASKDNLRLHTEPLAAKHQPELGNHGEAARMLFELLIEPRHAGEQVWECVSLVHLGRVYRTLRWGIAVMLFEQAIALADAIDFDRGKMMALNDLGEMKCSWGELEDSLALLEQSLSLVGAEDHAARRDVLDNLVVAHEGLDHLETCQDLLEEVVRLDRELGHENLHDDQRHLEAIRALCASEDAEGSD